MSKASRDPVPLNTIAYLDEDSIEEIVEQIPAATWGGITGTLSAQVDLNSALSGKEPVKGSDDNFVTDAEKVVIWNTSGTNTGDNAINSQYSGLAASKQDTLVSGTNIKTINSNSLLGSGDLVISGGSGLSHPQVMSRVSIGF